jgi:outer membrane protein assembly factor BamB
VYALDAATGNRRWTYNTHLNAVKCVGEAGQKNYNCFFTTEPTVWAVENGVVYGTIQNEVYALDAASGSKRWATTLDPSQVVAGKLAYNNGTLYAITNDIHTFIGGSPQYSYLYAFDARTGIKQWVTDRFTGFSIGPEVLNQIVYVGTQDGSVYAFNGNSGSLLWQKSFGPSDSLAFAIDNQTLYIQTDKPGPGSVGQHTSVTTNLFALNATDGVLRWHSRIDRNGWAGEVLSVSNGVIYVLTEVESNSAGQKPSFHLFLTAYDASNGHRLWSKPL